MRQPEVFFHVGLPKTGTTYLQRLIFPNLKGIQFYKKRLYDKHHDIIQNSDYDKYLFSCEFDKPLKERLLQIKINYPQAKIIVCFRPQVAWLASRYRYHIRKFGGATWAEFFSARNNDAIWKAEELYYMDIVNYIIEHFSEPPLVLNFESLKTDKKRFWNKIEEYTSTKLDSSFKDKIIKQNFDDKSLYVLRKFNRWRKYEHLPNSFPKFIRKTHYKLNELVLHMVVFYTKFLSKSVMNGEELLSKQSLEEVGVLYQEDWSKIEELGK